MSFFNVLRQSPKKTVTTITEVNPGTLSELSSWLKADAGVYSDLGVTEAVDGGTVEQWTDQSGTNYNVTQASSDLRPTFKTNQLNSLPIIQFLDGNSLTNLTSGSFDQPFSFIAAVKFTDNPLSPFLQNAIGGICGGHSVCLLSRNGSLEMVCSTGGSQFTSTPQITGNSAVPNDNWFIITVTVNGANSYVLVNGNTAAAGDLGTNSLNTLFIGGDSCTGMEVAEICKFTNLIDVNTIKGVELYLSNKWGISIVI